MAQKNLKFRTKDYEKSWNLVFGKKWEPCLKGSLIKVIFALNRKSFFFFFLGIKLIETKQTQMTNLAHFLGLVSKNTIINLLWSESTNFYHEYFNSLTSVRLFIRMFILLTRKTKICNTDPATLTQYLQGCFLTIRDLAFECTAPKVGHLMSP